MKHTIKKKDQDDVLYMLWIVTTSLESRTDPNRDILDKLSVESGYNVLNRVGYTENRPQWEDVNSQYQKQLAASRSRYLNAKKTVDEMIGD